NIRHICLPAEKTDDIKPKQLRRFYKDGLLDQDRLSQDVLDEAKLDLGTSGYNGQYGQSPKDPIGGMFQKHWFQYTDIIPSTGKKVRYWDLAATEKKDNNKPCWTVGLLMMKASDKKYYICDIVRLQGNPTKVENTIKLNAAMDGPSVDIWMEQEPGASAINTIDYYRRVVLPGYVFRPDKVGKSKVERARPLSVQAEAGNVVLLRGAKWCNAFLDEASFFPLSENMDQVDTASGAFNKLVMGGGFRATRI
ncbi:hypothetical protein KAR91_33075, partial [Candidatus Pacearchaeota archaeon]|nr:hypothetical protein [Candidatus Pacearchaeota archaeon]